MGKYRLILTKTFIKEYKKLLPKIQADVDTVLSKLENGESLDLKYKDHELKGKLKGIRDCHVRPDLILLYAIDNNELILTALRVNNHGNLGLN